MSISVTKNQQQNNFNPLKWAAYGAVGGYIAKDALPITKAEKEHYEFNQFVVDRKAHVKKAVEQELAAIRETIASGTKDKGYDEYIKFVENCDKDKSKKDEFLKSIEKMPEKVKATFNRLRSQMDDKVRSAKRDYNFVYEAAVKKYRPVAGYVFVGAVLSTGAAFVAHVLGKMSSSQS